TATEMDLLDPLDGAGAVELITELLRPGARLSANKVRRLARLLAHKVAAGHVAGFLRAWLATPEPEESPLAQAVLAELAPGPEPRLIERAARSLPVDLLCRLLTAINCCSGFPYDRELALAAALATHAEDQVRAWAQ